MSNEFHFITKWRLQATPEEVATVLSDALELPRWWPSVYLDVRVIGEGESDGTGRVVDLWTKGWLPYTLRWRFTTLRNDGPDGISLRADGDFVGGGAWTFVRDGDHVNAYYDWVAAGTDVHTPDSSSEARRLSVRCAHPHAGHLGRSVVLSNDRVSRNRSWVSPSSAITA